MIRGCSLMLAAFLFAGVVSAQNYPNKPIRLIVPFAAGGGTDIIARLIGTELTESMGQAVVIDNRGGSGGIVGTNLLAKAEPDGYTIGLCSLGFAYIPALYKSMPYDTEKDIAPISQVATQPFVFTAHPSLNISSMKELVALAKAKPGYLRYGSGGAGGASHLGTELLRSVAGIDLIHVPYKGTGPALTAAISGEIHFQLIGVSAAVPHLKSGRIKLLAVSGAKRSAAAPEIPTVAESGIAGYVFDVWYGMLAPGRIPQPILAKLNGEINRALRVPALAQRFGAAGLEPAGNTPAEFSRLIRDEVAKWRKIVASANIKVD